MGKIRISELPQLVSASLDTVLAGNDKGVTYKIPLSVLTQSVVEMLSASVDYRLDLLENFEADYNQMSASFLSIEQLNAYTESANTRLDNLETISASYLDFTQSYYSASASFDERITSTQQDLTSFATRTELNDFTQSYLTDSASFDTRIEAVNDNLVTTSSFNDLSQSYSTDSSSFDSRIYTLETTPGVTIAETPPDIPVGELWYNSNVGNLYLHYVSGTWIDTSNGVLQAILHDGSLLSTASFNSFSASVHTQIVAATNEQYLAGFATTSSLNTLSTSVDSRLDTLETFSSSADNRYVLSGSITQTTWDNIANKPNDIVSSSTQISALGFVTGAYTTINSFNNLTQSFNSISQSFTTISGSFGDIDFSGINAITSSYLSFTQSYYSASASVDSRITTEKNRIDAILSASNANSDTFAEVVSLINSVDLTNDNAFATFYTASNGRIASLENATSSYLTSLNGAISSSTQVLNGSGIYSSSVQLPNGLISSSLGFVETSSYSTDSASFNSRIISGSATIGTISSSAQISALGFISSSTTINTGSFATTGSNTFNGTQTISGSLNFSSGSILTGLAQYSGAILLQPVTDPDPLSQATTGTHIFVSSSNNQTGQDLYFRQQENKVKWKWLEGKLNTGILTGGVISYSGSLVYVKAGTGIIINHNASLTNEISPVTTYVSWNDYTASCQNITSSLATYLYVDNGGTIHQTDSYFTVTQYRTALPLGMVNHTGRNVITSVANNVATAYDDVSQTSDFIRAFGPMKLSGLTMSAATNSLKFTIEAGVSYILGGFYQQDPNNSSHKETTLIQTGSLSIARVRRNGNGSFIVDNNSGSFYNSIDSGYWDDGTGTLNSAGTGQWQIQRVFFNPFTNRCHIYYGQVVYTSFINAKQYLATDEFVEADYTSHQYVFLGYLIVKGQTNDISNTTNNAIIQSGLFRNTVGSSGGVQTFTHLHDLADVEVADPSNNDILSYNSSNGLWEHHNAAYLGLVTTGSFNTFTASLSGVISGSSQLTSSYDSRYVLSGSVSATGVVNTNFIKYTRSTQQTSLSNGSVIVCNVLENSSGNVISPNTSTGQITLTAGKTYRLKGMVPGFTTNAGNTRPQFCWYNETTAAYIGSSAETYVSGDAANYGAFGGAAEAIITPNVTTIVSFRLLSGATGLVGIGGNSDFSTTGSYPWIDIEEIGSTFALNTLNTMQISNNLAVTGSTTLKGAVNVGTGSGYEGGEIDLAFAQTTSLTGSSVVFDVYGDKVRIFEGGGNSRGVSIDLSKAPNSVGGELLWKASGLVNAGTYVSLDNVKCTISTSGNRSLVVTAVSTTFTANVSATFGYSAGNGGLAYNNQSITTSTSLPIISWGFNTEGDGATYILNDKTNNRVYRITIMIGASFNNNFISIERLY